MKKYRTVLITLICAVVMIALTYGAVFVSSLFSGSKEKIKVGFVYIGDSCDAYTNNFLKAQKYVETEFAEKVDILTKFNVPEDEAGKYIRQLVESECDLIFTTSYGYGNSAKEIASENPNIEICSLTCDNANLDTVLDNYHNAMGEIYQGRYISGVVAGMKMKEMIESGQLDESQAKVGYVGAFPYAEVISGYTAFILGVRSVVPTATMTVVYTNNWSDYDLEKKVTKKLIEDGCVIISQHSDTSGPAVVCEEMRDRYAVFHVGYNQSMANVAPTTSLISSRINWQGYISGAVEAVLNGRKIESAVAGNMHGNDISAGFDEGWVQMLSLNDTIAAKGTQKRIDELINDFKAGRINVFMGDYIGIDPYDPSDTFDLSEGFTENKTRSSPEFHYILKDIIRIEGQNE